MNAKVGLIARVKNQKTSAEGDDGVWSVFKVVSVGNRVKGMTVVKTISYIPDRNYLSGRALLGI